MGKGVTHRLVSVLCVGILSVLMGGSVARAEPQVNDVRFRTLRERMVREQIAEPPDSRNPVKDEKVLSAMRTVPRHLFVKPSDLSAAYGDHPLPIGYGQTISQPYVVALMTEMLQLKPEHRVLEVGTGSGYQAAVLSRLVGDVYTVEIKPILAERSRTLLQELGFRNVHAREGDGYFGWREEAPFDGIIVTCAAGHIPPPLLAQLRQGGRMVIPVGGFYEVQRLMVVTKDEDGMVRTQELLPVRFVPMTGAIQKQQ